MLILQINDIKTILDKIKEMTLEQKEYLIELDSTMGDGDLGLTMVKAFAAASEYASSSTENDIGSLLMKSGMAMAKAAPSTMGTLIGTGFMRGGKALKGTQEIDVSSYTMFWKHFVEGIMERGKSKPGEKTIVDALYPLYLALEKASKENKTLQEASQEASNAAKEGMEHTKTMVAQHGRAAYYQEKSRTAQDPGATFASMLIDVFNTYIHK